MSFAEPNELRYIQAFCNCSIAEIDLAFMSPTLNFEVGQIGQLPIIQDEAAELTVCSPLKTLVQFQRRTMTRLKPPGISNVILSFRSPHVAEEKG